MWELKRGSKITESLKVGDELLSITIDPEQVWRDYRGAIADVIRSRDAIASGGVDPDALLAAYGEALHRVMVVLLGAENTEKIVSFYEGRYIEMTEQVFPFINAALVPRIEAAITDMSDRLKQNYRDARGARRKAPWKKT